MRIITGSAKGLKLKTPKGLDVRPTSDRVKESVFNIIAHKIKNACVADLFAGTGNLGLEALSRGAQHAVFVDISGRSIKLIKENTLLAKMTQQAEFFPSDALAAITQFGSKKRRFNLVFCDPPYNRGLAVSVLAKLDESEILLPDGLIIVEHSKHETLPAALIQFSCIRTEHYGETVISLFAVKEEDNRGYENADCSMSRKL